MTGKNIIIIQRRVYIPKVHSLTSSGFSDIKLNLLRYCLSISGLVENGNVRVLLVINIGGKKNCLPIQMYTKTCSLINLYSFLAKGLLKGH